MNPYDEDQISDYQGQADFDQWRADLPGKRRPMTTNPNDFLMGGTPPEPEDDDSPPFVTAKYDGMCSACEEYHIAAGETKIRADGSNGWEAEECAW